MDMDAILSRLDLMERRQDARFDRVEGKVDRINGSIARAQVEIAQHTGQIRALGLEDEALAASIARGRAIDDDNSPLTRSRAKEYFFLIIGTAVAVFAVLKAFGLLR